MDFVEQFARDVVALGGKAYVIGGWVRDKIMGMPSKDIDIEVFGLPQPELEQLLSKYGEVNLVGKHFGVYKVGDYDVSLPRTEKKSGIGHKGFDVVPDPFLTTDEAVLRRDLTINAIFYDPIIGSYRDPVGGIKDIENGVLRYVNADTFMEDPLRVYRVMQFVGRFQFRVDPDLLRLCTEMVARGELDSLPRERVFEEFGKLLVRGNKPSLGLNFARYVGIIQRYFPELEILVGTMQEPDWHGEGDCWNHTLLVVDEGTKYRNSLEYPTAFMFACLCHDLGKPATTEVIDGRITSRGHEDEGEPIARKFMDKLTNNIQLIEQVAFLVRRHLLINNWYLNKPIRKSTAIKLYREMDKLGLNHKYLVAISRSDHFGRILSAPSGTDNMAKVTWFDELMSSLVVGPEAAARIVAALVTGMDLIAMNIKPGPRYKELLDSAYNYQVDNDIKDKELVLDFVRKMVGQQYEQNFNVMKELPSTTRTGLISKYEIGKRIGEGMYGQAFSGREDRVVKLTTDKNEAYGVLKLINANFKHPNLVRYYSIKEIPHTPKRAWIIEMEKAEGQKLIGNKADLPAIAQVFDNYILSGRFRCVKLLSGVRVIYWDNGSVARRLSEKDFELLLSFSKQIKSLKCALIQELGENLDYLDIQSGNVVLMPNGMLKFFDIVIASRYEQNPSKDMIEDLIIDFYKFYRNIDARCVEVSYEFSNFLNAHQIPNNVIWATVIPRFKGMAYNFEHSWVELKINNEWYVVDITGPRQFGMLNLKPLMTRDQYRKLWISINPVDDRHRNEWGVPRYKPLTYEQNDAILAYLPKPVMTGLWRKYGITPKLRTKEPRGNRPKFLGEGSFGEAYTTYKKLGGRAVKLTRDIAEAYAVKKIIDAEFVHPNLARYYSIQEIPSEDECRRRWVIELEKVEGRLLNSDEESALYHARDYVEASLEKDNWTDEERDYQTKKMAEFGAQTMEFIKQLQSLYGAFYERFGLTSLDVHGNNVLITSNGQLKFFDIMRDFGDDAFRIQYEKIQFNPEWVRHEQNPIPLPHLHDVVLQKGTLKDVSPFIKSSKIQWGTIRKEELDIYKLVTTDGYKLALIAVKKQPEVKYYPEYGGVAPYLYLDRLEKYPDATIPGIGAIALAKLVELSKQKGYDGRVLLDATPNAEDFYIKMGMAFSEPPSWKYGSGGSRFLFTPNLAGAYLKRMESYLQTKGYQTNPDDEFEIGPPR